MAFKSAAYKNQQSIPEVLAAIQAGYRPSGACTPPTTLHANCRIQKSAGVAPSGEEWKWNWKPKVMGGKYTGTWDVY